MTMAKSPPLGNLATKLSSRGGFGSFGRQEELLLQCNCRGQERLWILQFRVETISLILWDLVL